MAQQSGRPQLRARSGKKTIHARDQSIVCSFRLLFASCGGDVAERVAVFASIGYSCNLAAVTASTVLSNGGGSSGGAAAFEAHARARYTTNAVGRKRAKTMIDRSMALDSRCEFSVAHVGLWTSAHRSAGDEKLASARASKRASALTTTTTTPPFSTWRA